MPRPCRALVLPTVARLDVHPTQRRSAARLATCHRPFGRPVRRPEARRVPRMRHPSGPAPPPPARRPYLIAVLAGLLTAAALIAWMRRRTDP